MTWSITATNCTDICEITIAQTNHRSSSYSCGEAVVATYADVGGRSGWTRGCRGEGVRRLVLVFVAISGKRQPVAIASDRKPEGRLRVVALNRVPEPADRGVKRSLRAKDRGGGLEPTPPRLRYDSLPFVSCTSRVEGGFVYIAYAHVLQ